MSYVPPSGSDVQKFIQALKRAQRELTKRLNDAYRPLGISCVQADALAALDVDEAMTLGELSELVVAESGNPSRLIDRMVASGWVNRTRRSDDRRLTQLMLTEEGRDLVGRVYTARAPVLDLIADELDGNNVSDLARLLGSWSAA